MDRAGLMTLVRGQVQERPEIRRYLSPEALELLEDEPVKVNFLEPICRDIARRITKRESNDLSGAVRRFLAKGLDDEFRKWADEFYRYDHPVFIDNSAQALVDSMILLTGQDKRQAIYDYFRGYLAEQRMNLTGKEAESLLTEAHGLVETHLEGMTRDIITIIAEKQ